MAKPKDPKNLTFGEIKTLLDKEYPTAFSTYDAFLILENFLTQRYEHLKNLREEGKEK